MKTEDLKEARELASRLKRALDPELGIARAAGERLVNHGDASAVSWVLSAGRDADSLVRLLRKQKPSP